MSEESALLRQSHTTAAAIHLTCAYDHLDRAASSLSELVRVSVGDIRVEFERRLAAIQHTQRLVEGAY